MTLDAALHSDIFRTYLVIILGILGFTGIDLGLPVLSTIWPFLIVLGLGLMAPMIVWLIRRAGTESKPGQ